MKFLRENLYNISRNEKNTESENNFKETCRN